MKISIFYLIWVVMIFGGAFLATIVPDSAIYTTGFIIGALSQVVLMTARDDK